MKLSLVSIHPEFISSYLNFGVFRSAIAHKSCEVEVVNLRDYAIDERGTVDSRVYGGGDGMLLRPEPLANCVLDLKKNSPEAKVVVPAPGGHSWSAAYAKSFAEKANHLILIAGRFAGIDQRFLDQYADVQVSVGDFVVSGGELPCLLIADSIVRFLPGALGHQDSANFDSFSSELSGFLEAPQYTRPSDFCGHAVPKVLLSGNHSEIAEWRTNSSRKITESLRPDLIKSRS
ncbi:MAG: tRNA (guanosine(37)-N1)-methyltransferase TrmD [Pseudobacteriovorax sp.]|nr:tRNA (guanosine(37)-N1)-methyltransferase TrmD [Pseudobacteriovorax sp.]